MKKLAQAALLALLTASFVIPTGAEAASSQQTSNAVTPASTTQVAKFSQLGKDDRRKSNYFNVNTAGHITVSVTQNHSTDTAYVYYSIARDRPDGTTTFYGSSNFDGNGSFSFTSKEPLPVGEYYIYFYSKERGRTSGTISVTTP